MKAIRFMDAQKTSILKQGEDGTPVPEFCRKAGISHQAAATLAHRKRKYKTQL